MDLLKKWRIFSKLDPGFVAEIKRVYLVGIDPQEVDLKWDEGAPSKLRWGGSVMIMRNGDVYSIALRFENLLLLGVNEFESVPPLLPVKIEALSGRGIQDISSGAEYVTVLTTDGCVCQWGKMYVVEEDRWVIQGPHFLSGVLQGKNIVQIDCGHTHTIALSQEGEVYSWRANRYGQLGTGSTTWEEKPVKISGLSGFERQIISVACGGWTSYALDSEGNVWSWGDHEDGALGYASSALQLFPKKVPVKNIQKIAAGNSHVLALTFTNTVYFWGKHYCHGENRRVTIKHMTEIPNVVDIAAIRGCPVSAFKTAEGKVYFWGFAYGRLIPKPVLTEFGSLPEAFLSLDSPMILKSMEIELKKEPWVDILRVAFDDVQGDVVFSVQGKLIHAHRGVLSFRSRYFKRKLDGMKENIADGKASIKILEFSYPVFRTFLLFLYTDRIEPLPRTAEDALELFVAARNFGEEDLRQRLEQFLEVFITEKNVCKIYSVAVQRNSKTLHDLAMDFIVPNLNAVMKAEEFFNMRDELQKGLMKELVDEEVFIGLKRRRKD